MTGSDVADGPAGDAPPARRGNAPALGRLFDAAPMPVAVFAGKDANLVYANGAAEPDRAGRFAARIRGDALTRDAIDRVVQTGEAETLGSVGTLHPWQDADGRVAGVVAIGVSAPHDAEAWDAASLLAFAVDAIGTYDWDIPSNRVAVSSRFATMFGLDPEAAAERLPVEAYLERIHAADRQRVIEEIETTIRTGARYDTEYRIHPLSGGERRVTARGRCRYDGDGRPIRFSGVVIDVTERRRTEEALRASEQRLRALFSGIDEGFCLAEMIVDAEGDAIDYRFLEVNPLFEEMTGLEDATGRTALDLVPGLERAWIDTYARVGLGGETLRFDSGSAAMGRWFDVFAMPMAPRGRFALVFRDVTRPRQAIEALTESERRFRNLADNAPVMVWVTEPDGRCTYLSRSWYAFTGQTEAEALGFGWLDAVHPDDRGWSAETFREASDRAAPFSLEYRLRHADGTYRWAIDAAAPRLAEDGTFLGYVGSVVDITDRKRAEESQALLVRELNHRVKNLFAVFGSMITLTARRSGSVAEMAAALSGRLAALSRAHDLVRPTADGEDAPTRLSDLVAAILAPHLGDPSRAKVEGPDEAVGPRAATALALILHELATNAAKYGGLSKPEGRLDIVWRKEADHLLLVWRETGGPPVGEPPVRRGFGSQLSHMTARGQLDGDIGFAWEPTGVQITLSAALDRLRV